MRNWFFFNDTATTEIYTLSLHDALPIWAAADRLRAGDGGVRAAPGTRGNAIQRPLVRQRRPERRGRPPGVHGLRRSEEHTSELQSRQYLVCRLLLEKKKYASLVTSFIDT